MPAGLGLWWGTIEGAGIVELIDAAGSAGFGTISVTPAMYFAALDAGETDASLRRRLDATGVTVAMIDPLIRGLPGAPDPSQVAKRFRSTFVHGPADCWRAAAALGAGALNVAHYLCDAVGEPQLVEFIGGLADEGTRRGCDVLVEFMPEGSIPDLRVASSIIASIDRSNAGVMLDTWHHFRTGGDVESVLKLPPATVKAMQLSDAPESYRSTGARPPGADRLMPGEGVIPLTGIVAAARANNPGVVIGIEVFNRELAARPARDRAARAMAALERVV